MTHDTTHSGSPGDNHLVTRPDDTGGSFDSNESMHSLDERAAEFCSLQLSRIQPISGVVAISVRRGGTASGPRHVLGAWAPIRDTVIKEALTLGRCGRPFWGEVTRWGGGGQGGAQRGRTKLMRAVLF